MVLKLAQNLVGTQLSNNSGQIKVVFGWQTTDKHTFYVLNRPQYSLVSPLLTAVSLVNTIYDA